MATIRSAAESLPDVVLFDFDGVLLHGNGFHLFVRERYAQSAWRKLLALLAGPLLLLLWPMSRRLVRYLLTRLAFIGVSAEHYTDLARAMAVTLVHWPRLFNREGLQAFRRHLATGDRVIVVTENEEQLVRSIFAELGLSGFELLASQFGSGWLGVKQVLHNSGQRKVERLAALGVNAWAVAYSLSAQDLPVLRLASDPVLVNSSPKGCKKVEKALGQYVRRVDWH